MRPSTSPAILDQASPELCRLYYKNKFAFKEYLGSASSGSPDLRVGVAGVSSIFSLIFKWFGGFCVSSCGNN